MDKEAIEKVMKRCQAGTTNYDDANNLHAECYGTIGRLMTEALVDNKAWVITWRYSDGSGSGIVNEMAYRDFNAAQHVCTTLRDADYSKQYQLIELGVIQGELR